MYKAHIFCNDHQQTLVSKKKTITKNFIKWYCTCQKPHVRVCISFFFFIKTQFMLFLLKTKAENISDSSNEIHTRTPTKKSPENVVSLTSFFLVIFFFWVNYKTTTIETCLVSFEQTDFKIKPCSKEFSSSFTILFT